MRRPSAIVAWATGVAGVLLVAYNLLGAYTTLLGFASPQLLRTFGTPAAWLLLFICFCTLWWQLRHPETPAVDGVVYREMMRLRQENEQLRQTVESIAPRRLTDSQRNLIRARLAPLVAKAGRAPQISIFWTGSGDTANLAKDFEELLEAIGFSLLHVSGPRMYMLKHDYHYGIWVRHDSKADAARSLPPIGRELVTVLRDAGVEDVIDFDHEGHYLLEMIIGARYRTEADAKRQRDDLEQPGRPLFVR